MTRSGGQYRIGTEDEYNFQTIHVWRISEPGHDGREMYL